MEAKDELDRRTIELSNVLILVFPSVGLYEMGLWVKAIHEKRMRKKPIIVVYPMEGERAQCIDTFTSYVTRLDAKAREEEDSDCWRSEDAWHCLFLTTDTALAKASISRIRHMLSVYRLRTPRKGQDILSALRLPEVTSTDKKPPIENTSETPDLPIVNGQNLIPIDVIITDDSVVLVADMPGVHKENSTLHVSVVGKEVEIRYLTDARPEPQAMFRNIQLPNRFSNNHYSWELEHGQLEIYIEPKQ